MIYEVTVLLDDGATITFQVLAASPAAAEELAMQEALEHMQRPVKVEEVHV
jgi:hypothetical protein